MPPIRVNRRRFLGASAVAGIALAQQDAPAAAQASDPSRLLRVGLIGLGSRGTALARAALEIPGVVVSAVADAEPRHRARAQGIVEKATRRRPDAVEGGDALLARDDVDAAIVALPCDLHAEAYRAAIRAGKHLYAEKPLAPTLAECDAVIDEAAKRPDLAVHVGFQRRSNPRYQRGIELLRRGDLGRLIELRAAWTSSNGPVDGHGCWLASRARSGDWMVEQAVHVWDLLAWLKGGPPVEAAGWGDRLAFEKVQPGRDVTDYYRVTLRWADGFSASMVHSWIDPADDGFTGVTQRVVAVGGGFDFQSGVATSRDRSEPRRSIHPGPQPDTRLALSAFVEAARAGGPSSPPISLAEAREATRIGLLVRRAVDEARPVALSEASDPAPGAAEFA